ncbi:MAG TPA: hypothetical protein VJT81_20320 [Burkholderiales bacterium]|nr:hypothetical protein [Burkholderiales bacterium]
MLFRVVWFCLCLAAAQALAHSESKGTGPALLDCENPPESLASALPEQVARVASIECNPSAQTIVAREGWSWRYPGSFFDRPIIPAYAPMDSRQLGGPRYFTEFKATELSATEAMRRHERFAKDLPTYREKVPPIRLVKLVAHNDLGHELDAYFGFRSDREGWVVLCVPECASEYLFLMHEID